MAEITPKQLYLGLNLNSITSQVKPGQYTYGLNGVVEGFDGNSFTVQNEQGNILCTNFPEGYKIIAAEGILEKNMIVFFSVKEDNSDSEIGVVDTTTCTYTKKIGGECIGFDINRPIHKIVTKVTSFSTELYWADPIRRFLDLEKLPYLEVEGDGCENTITTEIDCNKLSIQPDFAIPEITFQEINGDGEMEAGTYQFGLAYSNALSEAYTPYYSITNPLSIFDPNKITSDFNYKVNKSINIEIDNLDTTGYYDYFNLIVVKTVNNIATPYLVGTYKITKEHQIISYTGQNKEEITLTLPDITTKYPVYSTAEDVTTAQDVIIWAGVATNVQVNYQKIWSKVSLKWQTQRLKGDKPYKDLNTAKKKGYFRDEIYALEGCFLLRNGYQTNTFHIPSRPANAYDLESVYNKDVLDTTSTECNEAAEPLPRWKVYNTAIVYGQEPEFIANATDDCYEGPHEYGDFAYWESSELYPCNTEIWGDDANKPIRHHKFPDSAITHIHDNRGYVYPIGIKLDQQELVNLINNSDLTEEQKADIVGFKITRANRANNKSVVARGLINNVGKYTKDDTDYFYPNYPFNDLRADPFISGNSTNLEGDPVPAVVSNLCAKYLLVPDSDGPTEYQITSCSNVVEFVTIEPETTLEVCSMVDPIGGNFNMIGLCASEEVVTPSPIVIETTLLNGFATEDSTLRHSFHSPDTHFYQPTLGNILKLETAEFGKSSGHYQQVKNHSKYKFISGNAFLTALGIGIGVGFFSATYGVSNNIFNGTAAFTAYKTFIDIVDKVIPRKNFAYQFNSVGNYDDYVKVQNTGYKQRRLDIATYASPGILSVGDAHNLNNYQRESSVYLRTTDSLPYPSQLPKVPVDNSRWTLSGEGTCSTPTKLIEKDISSYYATIKKNFTNQYGQLYSYESIDTGFQAPITADAIISDADRYKIIFGGDCFINRFALKTKVPFFIDNRVDGLDDSDIFYNEIGNIGNPNYWFSTDASEGDYRVLGLQLGGLFGIKAFNFDCDDTKFFYNAGKMYLFAYGIPSFFCESEVNVDLRQAYNGKEGDFYPHVSSGIPDDWLQETNVTIAYDNTYTYNKSFSKQNKENSFSHLPEDYFEDNARHEMPFRAIFSEAQDDIVNYRRNNWLVYRPAAKFDFPQNFGRLTSIDGIEDKQVLVRFENKSLLYNALLTAPTSAGDVYLGQSLFSSKVPPLDYGNTDLGYAGSQHKFLLKTEFGHVSIDAKRGQAFLIQGRTAKDITNENVSKFFMEYLPFKILESFPEYPVDNTFTGCGLTGVYDNMYKRFLLTKIDYIPSEEVTYRDNKFFVDGEEVALGDTRYFCNNSFTISYSFLLENWVFFHSYLPNYYIGGTGKFYSGEQDGLWKHNDSITLFNNYNGKKQPYIIEYPYSYKMQDEILQSVQDYSRILQYTDYESFVETDDYYFNKCIIYSGQQCSGVLELTKKPKNNLSLQGTFPKYHENSKEILYTKSDSFYNFNTFWDLIKDKKQPIWKKSCEYVGKELNQENMSYSKRAFRKAPIRSKELKIRMINDKYDDLRFISQFTLTETQKSYK